MFIVFGLLVMALVFMLMMRAIKLWFYAIFSPLMTLKYVLGDGVFGGKENSSSFDLKEFFGLAFVPALVGISLSFGLIVIAALKIAGGTDGTGPNAKQGDCLETTTGCSITIMGNSENTITTKVIKDAEKKITQTVVKFGGISYTYNGSVSGSSGDMTK